LHLVGDRKRREEGLAAPIAHLGRGEHRAEIVGRMAGFAWSNVAIHEIEVPTKCSVEESRPIGSRLATTDERCDRVTAKLLVKCLDGDNWTRRQDADWQRRSYRALGS
jgi:hypothetical protein